ncbi:MAG: PilZ domain-containing protein [Sphingomonadales bacterium]|nr:MAG: PilZ domain-containing protein [Sphingomonadales bacterium]
MSAQLSGLASDRRGSPRYRVESMCVIRDGEQSLAGRLQEISASGAYLVMRQRPDLGHKVTLSHPFAGEIGATVTRHDQYGCGLQFELGESAVGFALRAIAADMTTAHALTLLD